MFYLQASPVNAMENKLQEVQFSCFNDLQSTFSDDFMNSKNGFPLPL
jgi:hypothetical protein